MRTTFKRRVSYIGLFLASAYLIAVAAFVITKQDIFLTMMEVFTIISAFYILLFLETILSDCPKEKQTIKHLALISMAGCIILTSSAHIVNLTVTRPLISQGVDVPLFFQIGQWPSVEMALDYIAWGLFLGIAFLCTASTANNNMLKRTLFVCGSLCLIGFIGPVINCVNLWYVAVLGYTVGLIVVCIEQIALSGKNKFN